MAFSATTRKWMGLMALIPAIAMVFIDQSVLPVALPTIQKQLGATTMELWWSINSYLLVSAVLLLVGGKIGDQFGYRRTFLWGIMIFAIASALCGLSLNMNWLIGSRALQGLGAALMIPASAPLIMTLFSPKERGKALGINVSVGSLFLIIAPLIGGYFTEALSWRWIFWINLPLAVAGLFLVLYFIPKSPKGNQKIDLWGFLFFTLACSCLIMLIMQGSLWGWTSLMSGGALLLSLVGTLLLIWREKYAEHPFIDLSLFRHPIYNAINISIFATQFVLMITIYRAVFFQDTLDWSPLKSGVVFSVTSIPVLFMSPIAGWFADRSGSKLPIAVGFLLLIYSFFWSAFFVQSPLWLLILGFFALGIGVPLIFTPSYSSAMESIPPKKAGVAFGVLATNRALSSSLGVAVISSFANHVQLNSFEALIQKNPETSTLAPSLIESLATGAQNALKSLTPNQLQLVLDYLKTSQIKGFFSIHMAIGVALIIAFACVFVLYRRKPSHHLPEAPAEGWD